MLEVIRKYRESKNGAATALSHTSASNGISFAFRCLPAENNLALVLVGRDRH
jgi:hypothetical protein